MSDSSASNSRQDENSPQVEDQPHVEATSDDDWKERVKAEDARLDAERQSQSGSTGQQADTDAAQESSKTAQPDLSQIPPASFASLIEMLVAQVFGSLGVIPSDHGVEDPQLPIAKHLIDTLSVLEEKTKGNLTPEEMKLLDQALHELRMVYIQVSQRVKHSSK